MSTGSVVTLIITIVVVCGALFFVRRAKRAEREAARNRTHSNAYRGATFDEATLLREGGRGSQEGPGGAA